MSVRFYVALLALSSLAAAADPDCEELVKTLEDRSQLPGKWIFYAGTSDNEVKLNELKTINSSWIELSLIPDTNDMTLGWGDRVGEKCVTGVVNTTFSGNTTSVTFNYNGSSHEHVGRNLVACPDCTVWVDTSETTGKTGQSRNLYIFTKTGTLDAAHLEVFKKQAACLKFPSDFHFGGNTDLCPSADVKEEEQ